MFRFYITLFLLFMMFGCGSSHAPSAGNGGDNGGGNGETEVTLPENGSCSEGSFYRLQMGKCYTLRHPEWGFKGFSVPEANLYRVTECTQSALRAALDQIGTSGGRVILPACTFTLDDTIGLYDNTIFEGAGIDKTIIHGSTNDLLSLRGKNIIVRGMTLDGQNRSLGGVVGTNNRGNILIENVRIKDLRGSGVYLVTGAPQADTAITIRGNSISGTLHGIVVKTEASAKMSILSNHLYDNREYGIDISNTSDVEIAGNYMHDNYYAGAKSPAADGIWYRYNDIHANGKSPDREDRAGIVYMGSNPNAKIYLEYNDLRHNGGLAFASWSGHFAYLLLKNNLTADSTDVNGYNIRATGVDLIDVYGDNGKIWVGEGNEDRIRYH